METAIFLLILNPHAVLLCGTHWACLVVRFAPKVFVRVVTGIW